MQVIGFQLTFVILKCIKIKAVYVRNSKHFCLSMPKILELLLHTRNLKLNKHSNLEKYIILMEF